VKALRSEEASRQQKLTEARRYECSRRYEYPPTHPHLNIPLPPPLPSPLPSRYEFHYSRFQQHQAGVQSHPALLALARGAVELLGAAIDASYPTSRSGSSSSAALGGGVNQVGPLACLYW
jgi:hypothetical protein